MTRMARIGKPKVGRVLWTSRAPTSPARPEDSPYPAVAAGVFTPSFFAHGASAGMMLG
jgi:hypothetical protein